MLSKLTPRMRRLIILAVLAVVVVLGVIQVTDAIQRQRLAREALDAIQVTAGANTDERKAQQEAVEAWRQNQEKTLFWSNMASPFNASITVLLSVFGALGTAIAFLETREKERQDRADAADKDRIAREDAQAKDREERLAAGFSETLKLLVSGEARERVVGASSLIFFLAPERADYHTRAAGALAAALRNSETPEVRQGLRLAAEHAVRTLDAATLRQVSWQGVKLRGADLTGGDLTGIDLRDADLQDTRLADTKFSGAKLVNAQLQGADLARADLGGAELIYADLAGATLAQATLAGANLAHVRVLNLDLEGAEIDETVVEWRGVPWDATKNWRAAKLSGPVRDALVARYGEEAPDLEVLMLMWEMPPFVAGGTWTACYHLVRQLHRRGARVTIAVPWIRSRLVESPFGVDVPIIDMGMEPPTGGASPYGFGAASPYGQVSSPYGFWASSPYAQASSPYGFWSSSAYGQASSPYGGGWFPGPYGSGTSGNAYGSMRAGGSTLYALIGEFERRVAARLIGQPAQVIHAHDWVTFDAARALAAKAGVPWIAHFHSTEAERQPSTPDPLTARIEQGAVDSARLVIVPSDITRQAVLAAYKADSGKVEAIPNLLSEEPPPAGELGRFETKRVIFLGRLSEQKGVDRYLDIAELAVTTNTALRFEIYGEGPEQFRLGGRTVWQQGPLQWSERGRAFRGATALIVPSRAEPFGMVILEAMQHRVPVIYSASAGAAEVLDSGIKLAGDDIKGMAAGLLRLAEDLGYWETVVSEQAAEIERYPARNYEDLVIAAWKQAVAA